MNKKKVTAAVLVISVIGGNIVMPCTDVYAADGSSAKKEEVVYIMTDAGGSVDSVNVVNIFGKGKITDYGQYSSVKMLTSTEPISQNGDVITFSTNEDRVYYQGSMENARIPWNISITYTLDGKEITADKLCGKSGALKMRLRITGNTACANDYYNNYALQAAITLDTRLCKNIEADGATVANVGSDKQISYTALPGKGIDAVVCADVTDFEMDAVTVNGIRLNLNIDIDDDELMDKVTEIMDASEKINDGAAALTDGTDKLNKAGNKINDGADELYTATGTLDNGINSLDKGVTAIQEGLKKLDSKSASLTTGSSQIKTALKTIRSGLADVSVSTEQLKQLTDSSSAIKQGISNIYNGAVTLQTNLSYEAYKSAMGKNGLNVDELKAGNTAAIESLSGQLQELQSSLGQLKGIPGYETNEEYVKQIGQLEAQIKSLTNIITLLNGNNAAINGTKGYLDSVSTGMDSLVNGLSDLKTNYEKFDAAVLTLTNTLSGLSVNMGNLKSGIEQLVNNYSTLDSGITEYTDGVASIVANYNKLVDGVSTLASGSKKLLEGTGTLKQGTSGLYDGIVSLGDGAKELNDGTSEFYEKTSDMDTQVEDSIDEMTASISDDSTEVISFASDKNTNIASVQFVIKTASIEKPEVSASENTTSVKMNFWQKLLHLFGL